LVRRQGIWGNRETHPLITQEELAKNHTDQLKLSFLLFDEIEKASDLALATTAWNPWTRRP